MLLRVPPGPLARVGLRVRDVLETNSAALLGSQADSYCCRFSRRPGGGHLLASADEDGAIKLWDTRPTAETALLQYVPAHTNAIYELDWSSDGRHLLSAAGDRAIKLWDTERFTLLAEFRRHSRTVKTVTFLPEDPCVFASGGRDGVVEVWDVRVVRQVSHEIHSQGRQTGGRGRRANTAPASVTSLVFRDETYLLSATSSDSAVSVWDLRKHYSAASRQPLPVFQLDGCAAPDRGVVSMAADRRLGLLYVSRIHDVIQRYSMTNWTAEPGGSFTGHACGSFFVRCGLSADGRLLVSGSSDRFAYLWSAASPGPPVGRLPGHADEVTCVSWSLDGRTLATVCDDLRLRLWRADLCPAEGGPELPVGDPLLMEPLTAPARPPLPRYTLCRETGTRWRPRSAVPTRPASRPPPGAATPPAGRHRGRRARPATPGSSEFLTSWLNGAGTPVRRSPRKRAFAGPGRPDTPTAPTQSPCGGQAGAASQPNRPCTPTQSPSKRPAGSTGEPRTPTRSTSRRQAGSESDACSPTRSPTRRQPSAAGDSSGPVTPRRTSPRKTAASCARAAAGQTTLERAASTPAAALPGQTPPSPARRSPRKSFAKELFAPSAPAGCGCGGACACAGSPATPRRPAGRSPLQYRSPTADLPNWAVDGLSPHRPLAGRPRRPARADWLTRLSQRKRAQASPGAAPPLEKRARPSGRGTRQKPR